MVSGGSGRLTGMEEWMQVAVTVFAFVGTGMQAKASLNELSEVDAASVRTYQVHAKTRSRALLHPWKYRQEQRRREGDVSPLARKQFERVWSQLWSWNLLFTATGIAFLMSLHEAVF